MDKVISEFVLVNILGEKRSVKGYITDVEDDCIHIKTIDGKNICISR